MSDPRKFLPGIKTRCECGGPFAPFSNAPDGSIHGWCLFCRSRCEISAEAIAAAKAKASEGIPVSGEGQ